MHAENDEVAGAHLDDAVGDLEPLQDLRRVVDERIELGERLLGRHELHHLDLVELVAALDAAHVLAGAIFSRRKQAV